MPGYWTKSYNSSKDSAWQSAAIYQDGNGLTRSSEHTHTKKAFTESKHVHLMYSKWLLQQEFIHVVEHCIVLLAYIH